MSQLILSVACEMVFITIHVHCMFVGLFGVRLLSFSVTTVVDRDAYSPAIFIPRGFGESGNGNLSFPGDRGNENLFPGFRVGVRGNFGEYFVSDLKLI